jgi:DeoR/GlpR family transcriptional regulator of sugar metabolism
MEVRRFNIDLCLLGTCALSVKTGVAGFSAEDVDFKRGLLEQSAQTAVLVTNEKLETVAPHIVGPFNGIRHVVVEHDTPSSVLAAMRKAGVLVIVAAPLRTRS